MSVRRFGLQQHFPTRLMDEKDNSGVCARAVNASCVAVCDWCCTGTPLHIMPPHLYKPCAVGQVLIRGVSWFIVYSFPLAGCQSKRSQPKLQPAIHETGLISARWIRPVPLMDCCNFG